MQQKENKKVELIINEENNFYGIAFIIDNIKEREKIKRINHCFIKYHGEYSLKNETGQELDKSYVIKFDNMPKKLLETICEVIEDKMKQENLSAEKSLKFILDLFKKMKFNKEIKEILIGDIGEVIFMLKCKEQGINADEKIRQSENNLYDFVFNNIFVEVKSSSKNLSEIIVDYRQITESNKKKFVVSKFQLLENEMNICNLYEKLNSYNEIIQSKYKKYKEMLEDEQIRDVMKENTVDLSRIECFILEDSVIPKIQIQHEGGLKNLKCHISITNCKKIDLGILKEYI